MSPFELTDQRAGREGDLTVQSKRLESSVRHIQLDISKSLSDEEWKSLRAFCEKAKRLADTRLASSESHIRGRVQFDVDKGGKFEATLPPEEQVAEFLMAFRFFYLQDEPTCFLKVLAMLGRHSKENREARQGLKSYRRQWEGALFQESVQVSFNNKKVTAAGLIDLWFNAHYFHANPVKAAELDELKKFVSEPFAKFMLLDATYTATKVIFKLHHGLKELVARRFAGTG